MASSTPKKKSTAKKSRSTAKTWKRAVGEDVELPSGNVCLAKRPGPAALLQKGMLPDTLAPLVQGAIREKKGLPPEELEAMLDDGEKVLDMLDAVDRMTALIVVEPKVKYHRREVQGDDNGSAEWQDIPNDERDSDEFLYTDEIDLEDKMFLFNFAVGGTRDWERFRDERSALVGDVHSGQADEGSSE